MYFPLPSLITGGVLHGISWWHPPIDPMFHPPTSRFRHWPPTRPAPQAVASTAPRPEAHRVALPLKAEKLRLPRRLSLKNPPMFIIFPRKWSINYGEPLNHPINCANPEELNLYTLVSWPRCDFSKKHTEYATRSMYDNNKWQSYEWHQTTVWCQTLGGKNFQPSTGSG